jgi:antitoxin component HigA of HigAB toxin-antitoxin module
MHKLGGSVMQSDNAPNAIKMKAEVQKYVLESYRELLGADVFDKLSKEEQAAKVKIWEATCERHLFNTYLAGGVKAELELLTAKYGSSLAELPKELGATLNVSKVLHAIAKAYGTGQCVYGKGFGEGDWLSMIESEMAGEFVPSIQRVDRGTRMDASTSAAMIGNWLRPKLVKCLSEARFKAPNRLRDNLYATLSSKIIIATLRARSIINDKITNDVMYLCAAEELEWSCVDVAIVHQYLLKSLDVKREGLEATFLDRAWSPFQALAEAEPLYEAWRERVARHEARAVGGSTVRDVELMRNELYAPEDPSNADPEVLEMVKDIVLAWLAGMKKTLLGGQGARRVGGGDLANATPEMKAVFEGTWTTTNLLESLFALEKYYDSLFTNIAPEHSGAMAIAKRNKLFGVCARKYVKYRRRRNGASKSTVKKHRREKEHGGRLNDLPKAVLKMIMTVARRRRLENRALSRKDKSEVQAAHTKSNKRKQEDQLNRQVKKYAKAMKTLEAEPLVADSDVATCEPGELARMLDEAR